MDIGTIKKDFLLYGISVKEYAEMHGLDASLVRRAVAGTYAKRGVARRALEMHDAGLGIEDIAMALGTSVGYLKNFLSVKDNGRIRKQCFMMRNEGYTFAQIAAKLGISIGSVQNYLKVKKGMVMRIDIETGHRLIFLSLAQILQYNPGLTKKRIKDMIDTDDIYFGYRFETVKEINWTDDIAG